MSVDDMTQKQIELAETTADVLFNLANDISTLHSLEGVSPPTKAELMDWSAKLIGIGCGLNRITVLANFYEDPFEENGKYILPDNYYE